MVHKYIKVRGARVHNLKNINVDIPRDKLVVLTGISGSGKSSLAFDTLYAEGQRRYVESLSNYARQFLGLMDKPDVDSIEGLSPAISIDQRSASANPRSTVGTVTEIYDYLRLLFARIGQVHCPQCGQRIKKQTSTEIIDDIFKLNSRNVIVLAPIVLNQNGERKKTIAEIKKAGFRQVRVDGEFYDIQAAGELNLDSNKMNELAVVVGKITAETSPDKRIMKENLTRLVELGLDLGNGQIVAMLESGQQLQFCQYSHCYNCHLDLPNFESRNFSFNSPAGACPKCLGLGTRLEVDPALVIPNKKLTLAQGAIKPFARNFANQNYYWQLLQATAKENNFSLDVPVELLKKKDFDLILNGTKEKTYNISGQSMTFPGILAILAEKHSSTTSDYLRQEIEQYMRVFICPTCQGKRLKPESLAVLLGGLNISAITNLTIEKALVFFEDLLKSKSSPTALSVRDHKIADLIFREVINRLGYLINVGLNYLTLDRSSVTLAGGEAQRIRLATQLGLSLTGVVYILDEPSIGLHQKDNKKLIETLQYLRDLGNTVIVVEHDSMMMQAADEIIDIGPGAGEYGGKVVAQASPALIMKDKNSLTGQYLAGKLAIKLPKAYRRGTGKYLEIIGAKEFNLKNIDVKIPLGKFICLTGVSGSGKSTLMLEILVKALAQKFYRAKDLPGQYKELKGLENIDKVIAIDQSPIGRTPRSNPATYTGLFTYIRDLFTQTKEAKIRGYKAGKFSFNAKGGRCETCTGEGYVKIEMQFLPDVYVQCEECHGQRYKAEVLEIHYQGRNIADILNMSVEEAMKFFGQHDIINNKLKTLYNVGLGYVKLGQPATTLSGGEAQRVKLATELSRRSTGKTLYILDEPTTGLHFEDIKCLLQVLNQLVDKGNTVLIIEHNLDVIKCADWLIDLGPEGGDKGGYIVAEGTPKDIVKVTKSYTGRYLKEVLA
ncbi:MAG: excinuclease ABC subunit A [Candidatus Buchananbacteria bacterium RIFCSPLOWO2_01_FULL_46_12]|uniref:UvrABC system protein A n=2 Tax=Candidatus Buchananiibacteriota TaxID=1817903 RepID=A0A1G1YNM8_9BACT|nr:MAG: excinuclease ABC subunit A [Candidatus Buchananbacteria bacterium RIFCSPHIGHO2_01_FULL_44_11]OGY53406.1 MAG: excinuclease ABC subunit A [Candidatus Buchananbacteria bacterium RIFCSPLOWO2_01_FULL_46_12]